MRHLFKPYFDLSDFLSREKVKSSNKTEAEVLFWIRKLIWKEMFWIKPDVEGKILNPSHDLTGNSQDMFWQGIFWIQNLIWQWNIQEPEPHLAGNIPDPDLAKGSRSNQFRILF